MNDKKITEDIQRKIARFLPDALARALDSYRIFSQNKPKEDANAKDFAAHHNACKVAIAHIELLIKLAQWADLPDSNAENHNRQIVLAGLLKEAEEEVEAYGKVNDKEQ